jgi:hypothetical protein
MTNKKANLMADEELQTYLKDTRFYRELKNHFSELDSENTKEIKAEFGRRKITVYASEDITADITVGEAKSPNMKSILEDYPLEKLYSMGVLGVDLKKLKEKTKKKDEEMAPYISKKPGKRQLNIKPTKHMSKEAEKRIMEKIYSQLHEKFG